MFSKISNKIAIIVVALLIISFSIFAFLNFSETKSTMIDMTKNAKDVVSIADRVIVEQIMAPKIDAVNKLVDYLERNPNLTTTSEGLERLKKIFPEITGNAGTSQIFFGFASNGSLFNTTLKVGKHPEFLELTVSRDNYDARSRDWYKGAIAKGGLSFSTPYIAKTVERLSVTISKPVKVDGNVVGVVGTDIYIDEIGDILHNLKDSETSINVLLDLTSENVIYHPDSSLIMSSDSKSKNVVDTYESNYKKNGVAPFQY